MFKHQFAYFLNYLEVLDPVAWAVALVFYVVGGKVGDQKVALGSERRLFFGSADLRDSKNFEKKKFTHVAFNTHKNIFHNQFQVYLDGVAPRDTIFIKRLMYMTTSIIY